MNNIVLVGFMATGKSTVGRDLAGCLALDVTDTDDLIEEKAGKTISQIFADQGEEAFRDLESEVAREVSKLSRHVIVTGGGIVLREKNLAALKKAGPVFCLAASAETVLERTRGTSHRPLLEAEDPLDRIRELLAYRESFYAQADYVVDTSDLTVSEVRDRILEILSEHHPQILEHQG
jgi:shikimate kinase